MKQDNVNHPPHYTSGKIEVIEFIEDQGFGPGFCRGNAIKYAARAGKKNKATEIEDLEKAAWYLKREIEILKAAQENRAPIRPNDMNRQSISAIDALSLKTLERPKDIVKNAPLLPHADDEICKNCKHRRGAHWALKCSPCDNLGVFEGSGTFRKKQVV